VVACLFGFLLAKALFGRSGIDPVLFGYGLTVTLVILLQFFIALFLYKDPYNEARRRAKAGQWPMDILRPYTVSCLVAVHNEERIIEKCVASVCAQTYAHKEVIFVNDASTDNTGAILQELATRYPITVIDLKTNVGKKRALGAAMLASNGDIIAFTDSDSLWKPDAIEKCVEIFRYDPDIGAISGHSRALNGGRNFITKVQDSWYEGQYSIRKAFESYFGSVTCVSGPLAVFRRGAIYNYIPAWEQDSFLGREFKFATDRTLTGFVLGAKQVGERLKAKYAGSPFLTPDYPVREYKIVYTKAARALTEVPDRFGTVIKQQVRWKKSFIRNTFFTGAFYWRKPFVPAAAYYLHILFVLVGPFIVLRHLVYFPLHGETYNSLLYLLGILFVGYMFGLAYKLEDPQSRRWVYRPFMSLCSTLVLSWLIFYSALTIRKMKWHRG
jgi:cellulose synthase/poly-beta-1,6-N-acetylglucosamine synthase-like glycosyltransferase